MRFITYNNQASLPIPLNRAQDTSNFTNIIVLGANANVLSGCTGTGNIIRNWGANGIAASYDGDQTLTVTMSGGGTFWGNTLVIVAANYALF